MRPPSSALPPTVQIEPFRHALPARPRLPREKHARVPSYRRRRGSLHAIVTLTDSATGKRRDYWLGEFNTPASRELYFRLIAEWEANGRRFPEVSTAPRPGAASARLVADTGARGTEPAPGGWQQPETRSRRVARLTAAPEHDRRISGLVRAYWAWAKTYYSGSCAGGVRLALRVLRDCYGSADAAEFGPNALRIVREAMIRGRDDGERPRRPWCRKTVNTRTGHICRMFRWAASRELVSPQVYLALQSLPPLKRGRCAARDNEPVRPAPQDQIDAVRPLVSRQVRAMIDLQLLTAARPGEIVTMRGCDLDTTGAVWYYRPRTHKNAQSRVRVFVICLCDRGVSQGLPFVNGEYLDHLRPRLLSMVPKLLLDAGFHSIRSVGDKGLGFAQSCAERNGRCLAICVLRRDATKHENRVKLPEEPRARAECGRVLDAEPAWLVFRVEAARFKAYLGSLKFLDQLHKKPATGIRMAPKYLERYELIEVPSTFT